MTLIDVEDAGALPAWFPQRKQYEEHLETMRPDFERYVSEVGSAVHAMSLEASAFCVQLAKNRGAYKILDLGSGWSTFALAWSLPDCEIHAVDDSIDWLNKTRAFLSKWGVGMRNSQTLREYFDQWMARGWTTVGLAIHDLGDMQTRVATLALALASAPVVYLDDMHMAGYPQIVNQICSILGFDLIITTQTKDQYGRFGAVAARRET